MNKNETEIKCDFESGDHVYRWCRIVGVREEFQHHGIVLDRYWKEFDGDTNNINDEKGEWTLKIADFSIVDQKYYSQSVVFLPSQSPSRNGSSPSQSSSSNKYGFQTYEISLSSKDETWHKVIYSANWRQSQFQQTPTCTEVSSDRPEVVRSRVQFLMDHPHLLPKYDAVTADCECVAVWCKTGTWAILHETNWLRRLIFTAASFERLGSFFTVSRTVTVPVSGFWGLMGYTTAVVAAQPYFEPGLIMVAIVAVPLLWSLHAKNEAERTTEALNTLFLEKQNVKVQLTKH